MNYTSKGATMLKQIIEGRKLEPMTDDQWREIAPPRPPYPYTAEELERDNPHNQWMHETNNNEDTGLDQAKVHLDFILDVMARYDNALDDTERDEITTEILEYPLELSVRCAGWMPIGPDLEPDEYRVLLCTGGPAVQITGDIGPDDEPSSAKLKHQSWFTPWCTYPTSQAEQEVILRFVQIIAPTL